MKEGCGEGEPRRGKQAGRPKPSQSGSGRWERLEREGALDRGKRRPKRKSKEHLEKVAGARAGGMSVSQARKSGLWFMGNGEPHLEDLKGPASSDQRITLAAGLRTRWKAMTLKISKDALAQAPGTNHQGLGKGRGCVYAATGAAPRVS